MLEHILLDCFHENHFNISAQWHFYVTSHGKGVYDSVAGAVKRLAARDNLKLPYSLQRITPLSLHT
jgi:hypothetical protein